MRFHGLSLLLTTVLIVASCLLVGVPFAQAQQNADAAATNIPTIKVESRVVLVDTVVTDKKGNYLRDLTMKDFKVWEDDKEQTITSFSFEDDAASPTRAQKQYLVLFFDNSTMDAADQMRARQAAAQFIDANAGPEPADRSRRFRRHRSYFPELHCRRGAPEANRKRNQGFRR